MKKTKIIFAVLAVVMQISVPIAAFGIVANTTAPIVASAAAKTWSGKADTSWYDNSSNTYSIKTAEQLAGLAKLVNAGNNMSGVTINLKSDITLNKSTNCDKWDTEPPANTWTPIGTSNGTVSGYKPFSGTFNGNGYTISGLYTKTSYTAGLFGYLKGASVSGVMIADNFVTCVNTKKTVFAGGIAGISENSIISECEVQGIVYGRASTDILNGDHYSYVGGLVGSIHTEDMVSFVKTKSIKSSYVKDCIFWGETRAQGTNAYSGCFVGWGNNGKIENCLNLGFAMAKGNSKYIGAISGGLFHCTMSNCYYFDNDLKKGVGQIGAGGAAKDNAVRKTREQVMSADFTKKLGSKFKYVKDDRPVLTIMK